MFLPSQTVMHCRRPTLAAAVLVTVLSGLIALHRGSAPPILRTTSLGLDSVAVALDSRDERLFVANSGDNTVSVLDARSGAILRTVAVDLAPQAVAVDAQSGHAFVVSTGGVVRIPDGWAAPWLQRLHVWLPELPAPAVRLQAELGSVSVLAPTR